MQLHGVNHPPSVWLQVGVDDWRVCVTPEAAENKVPFPPSPAFALSGPRLQYSCPTCVVFVIFDYHLYYYLPNVFSFN